MSDHTTTAPQRDGLVCQWVQVTDGSGRTRMEARWASPHVAALAPHAA
ncbi:hypothetical protein [Nocardioides sp. Soil805]|nr:hypothetical protein [Nocardioides sp. Soil805]